jgi:hypothetical protein
MNDHLSLCRRWPTLMPMTSPLVLRPATAVDTDALERLAALDSARPLTGEVTLASVGGDVRAALSLETGRVVADPFYPSAELVELLRAAAGGSRPRRRWHRAGRAVRPALA